MSQPSPPLRGPALVLGADVNTDELHPSRFFSLEDATVRAGFLGAVQSGGASDPPPTPEGGIVVAARNFGCGSSRETGARVFLLAGVRAVVAGSFSRIFHRNLINLGLPALRCPAFDGPEPPPLPKGAPLIVDLATGHLRAEGHAWALEPLDPLLAQILAAGGLIPYLEQS